VAEKPSVGPRRLSDLDHRERLRAVLRTAAMIGFAWVVLIGVFYIDPVGDRSALRIFLRLGADIALVIAVLAWQTHQIVNDDLPELRAVQGLGIVIPVFLVAFSAIYLSLSHGRASTFSEPLDHTRALYFTISVFSTVGFGDIAPRTDLSRIVVSIQMLLDLVIIGAVVRLLINAAKVGLSRSQDQPSNT